MESSSLKGSWTRARYLDRIGAFKRQCLGHPCCLLEKTEAAQLSKGLTRGLVLGTLPLSALWSPASQERKHQRANLFPGYSVPAVKTPLPGLELDVRQTKEPGWILSGGGGNPALGEGFVLQIVVANLYLLEEGR